MAILTPDATFTLNGVNVNEYLLTRHNPNKISMPTVSMKNKVIGVTIHNTDWINTASGTTPAEQYTRATVNGNMNTVRVHYYCDNICAWQNLPLDLSGWHAADGSGDGNRRTIAIECIMSKNYNDKDKKSEDNAAKLAAYLLKQYNLSIEHLYTHTHWLNVRDGKRGSVDYLNTLHNSYKNCPLYILPHWSEFKAKVSSYLDDLNKVKPITGSTEPTTPDTQKADLYRVRLSWTDAKSQIGAYSNLDNAKAACKPGYTVFDSNGKAVYTSGIAKGSKVSLQNAPLYSGSSTTKKVRNITGTYYIYDGLNMNSRYRITTSQKNCGMTPIGKYVTGYVPKEYIQ